MKRAGVAAFMAVALGGCGPEGPYDPEDHFEEGTLGVWRAGLTVGEAGGCATSIVAGLSRQLIDEINCLRPDTLESFAGNGVRVNDGVFPFVQPAAKRGLRAAINARGANMTVNSALRTLAQQYLLYKWWQQGRCGISLAASPGRSNHESGLALDIADNAGWRGAMQNNGWRWLGANDPVHFDYVAGGTVQLAGLSVRAFQRLWNRNHPEDRIDEDGAYGPQTEARLRRSPTGGFPRGACEAEPPPPPPPPQDPDLTIVTRWLTIDGQARDLVPEGSSASIFDALQGQRFQASIELAVTQRAADELTIGYALSEPYLRAESLVVEKKVGEAWEALSPPVAMPAAEGRVEIGTTPAGETRRVRFELVAAQASFGEVPHAWLRGWVAHVANFYGEQDAWDDPVEHNDAGELLRHAGEADVFTRDDWRFLGPRLEDVEGWRGCDGAAVRIDPGFHALVAEAGCAESPAWTAIDASRFAGLRVGLRSGAPSARVHFGGEVAEVTLRGDGEPEELLLDLRGRAGWAGTVSALRIEADGPIALTRVAGLDPSDIVAPPPPPPDPDAGPVVPDAGAGPVAPTPDAGIDADVGPADGPDAGGLDLDPDPVGPRALALEAHHEGGCAATPLTGAPLLGLAALSLRRRRRR